jgi:hypothetical protein
MCPPATAATTYLPCPSMLHIATSCTHTHSGQRAYVHPQCVPVVTAHLLFGTRTLPCSRDKAAAPALLCMTARGSLLWRLTCRSCTLLMEAAHGLQLLNTVLPLPHWYSASRPGSCSTLLLMQAAHGSCSWSLHLLNTVLPVFSIPDWPTSFGGSIP